MAPIKLWVAAAFVAVLSYAGYLYYKESVARSEADRLQDQVSVLESTERRLTAELKKKTLEYVEMAKSAKSETEALKRSADQLSEEVNAYRKQVSSLRQEMKSEPKEIQACYGMPAPDSIIDRVYNGVQ